MTTYVPYVRRYGSEISQMQRPGRPASHASTAHCMCECERAIHLATSTYLMKETKAGSRGYVYIYRRNRNDSIK